MRKYVGSMWGPGLKRASETMDALIKSDEIEYTERGLSGLQSTGVLTRLCLKTQSSKM